MPIAPAAAMQELILHPKRFLSKYPLLTSGGPAGMQTNYLNNELGAAQRPGRVLGTLAMHATEGFRLSRLPGAPGDHAMPVQAFSVPLANSNVAPIVFHAVPLGGVRVLITGELSGCSFIINPGPGVGQIQCAHLMPVGESGLVLHNRLVTAGHTTVYGHGRYNKVNDAGFLVRNVTVIGIRKDSGWQVFAQKRDNPNRLKVLSLSRIY